MNALAGRPQEHRLATRAARAGLGLTVLLIGASFLEACLDCVLPCPAELAPSVLSPAMGATDVPVDALVWVSDQVAEQADAGAFTMAPATFTIVIDVSGPDGSVIGNQSRLTLDSSSGAITVFRPALPLSANTTYTVTINDGLVTSFTTGSGLSGPAPTVPSVKESHEHSAPFTCPFDDNMFTFNWSAFLTVAQFQGEESAFNPAVPSGQLDWYITAVSSPVIDIGTGGCSSWNGVAKSVRFGAFDPAGQFSGWTGWFDLS